MLELKKYKKIEESDYEKFERLLNLHMEMGYKIVENSYEVKDESDSQIFSQQIVLDNDFSLGDVSSSGLTPRIKKNYPDKLDYFGIRIIEKNKPLLYKRSFTKYIQWYENYQIKNIVYDGLSRYWYENGNRERSHYYLKGYDEPNSRKDRTVFHYESGSIMEIKEFYPPRTESWDMTHMSFSQYNYVTGWTSETHHDGGGLKEVTNWKHEYDGGKKGELSSGNWYVHGSYRRYYGDIVSCEGTYEYGKKHGEFKYYHVIDGYLRKKKNWNHGELIESISYNEDGNECECDEDGECK